MDLCGKEGQLSGKVAEFIVDRLTDQLKYAEVYKNAASREKQGENNK